MIDSIKVSHALNELQKKVNADSDIKEIMEYCLEALLDITQSQYGFIGSIEENSTQKYLKTLAITNISWDEGTRNFYESNFQKGMEFYNLDTLFGEVIKTENVVISNNPKKDSRYNGIPEGHPPLNSFLGIPFHYNGKFIGMCGIANAPEDYSFEDLVKLRALCTRIETLIYNQYTPKLISAHDFIKNEFLENIINASQEGVISINKKGIIQSVNKTSCNMLGYTKKQLLGQNINIIIPFPHKEKHDGYLKKYIRNMHSDIFNIERELKAEKKNGELFDIQLTVSKISSDTDEDVQLIGFIKDLSGQREYLDRLKQARISAEKAEKAKADFLSLVSHELRTPLNGIIGPLQLLELDKLENNQKEFVNMALQSANSLLNQLNRILEFSSISAGLFTPKENFFSSNELKCIIENNFKKQLQIKKLTMEFKNFEDEIFLKGDLKLLSQTVLTLVDNAIKFTKEGGVTVTLHSKPLKAPPTKLCESHKFLLISPLHSFMT